MRTRTVKTLQRRTSGSLSPGGLRLAGACLLLGAAILMEGCSKDPAGEPGGDLVEITASAAMPGGISVDAAQGNSPADGAGRTRGTVNGNSTLTFGFARSDNGGAWQAAFSATRASGTGNTNLTFSPSQYYPTDGTETRMAGWYPNSGTGYAYNAGARTVKWTIDGTQDIIVSQVAAGNKTNTAIGNFEFTHRLAQIQFWPYAESADVAAQWGRVTGITLDAQQPDFTMNLPQSGTAAPTFAGSGTAKGFTVRNLPGSGNMATTAAKVGDPMMIVPSTANKALDLTITTSAGKIVKVQVPARSYPQGSVTAIKLKFKALDIDVSLAVAEWTANTANKPALGGIPYVVNGHTIVCADIYGAANLPLHGAWITTPPHSETVWNENTSGDNAVSNKFTVAPTDAASDVDWATANTTCGDYIDPLGKKGTWRLPTARELQLLKDMWDSLYAIAGATGKYWSSTEHGFLPQAWVIHANDTKNPTLQMKSERQYAVRCVSDL